jgi:hypothetical protein
MEHVKRDNHFVPQAYLRRWSDDGVHIWSHRLLVSHEKVPLWEEKAISGVAFHRDLYTIMRGGSVSDKFEHWLEREFETPAGSALQKIEHGVPLSREDWERVAYYAAAQNLRTPAAYLEHVQRMEKTVPAWLSRILPESIAKLERAVKAGKPLPPPKSPGTLPRLPLRVHSEPAPDGNQMLLRAEVTIGRESWLEISRHLLTGVARVLTRHTWSIMYPDPGTEWFTSDHPLVRLNYYAPGSYDFKGGWGNPGSEILLPLSPKHLMYTRVGKRGPPTIQLTGDKTIEMQKLFAQHAHRSIYARTPMRRVCWFRKRRVDAPLFNSERDALKDWHSGQSMVERPASAAL